MQEGNKNTWQEMFYFLKDNIVNVFFIFGVTNVMCMFGVRLQ